MRAIALGVSSNVVIKEMVFSFGDKNVLVISNGPSSITLFL